MRALPKRYAVTAMAGIAAVSLAACGGSSSSSGTASSGKPVSGGTLHIVAASGPDHIDTVPAYYTADYELERMYTRQLLHYPTVAATSTSSAGWKSDTTPVADIATVVPSTSNGGITNGGKTYTFHIKSGVDWDSSPARQVTAADFIREFKAFCNPVSPVGNPVYYQSTIAGLTSYCNAETAYFASKSHAPTAANIANFQNTNNISGLSAPNSSTLQINLSGRRVTSSTCWRCRSPRPARWSTTATCRTACSWTRTRCPTGRTRSPRTRRASRSLSRATRPGSSPPTRSGTITSRDVVVTEGVASAATQLADMQAGTEDLTDDTTINAARRSRPDRQQAPQLRHLAVVQPRSRTSCSTCRARTAAAREEAARPAGGRVRRWTRRPW